MKKSDTRGLLKKIFGQSNKDIKLEIINNENYMEWLVKFTEQFPAWRDDMINYLAFNFSNEDKKNMVKLKCFFEIINNFAYENRIKSYHYDKEVYYLVKINNYRLQIGMIKGHDNCYYCQKEIRNNLEYIDFGNIKFQNTDTPLINYQDELLQLEMLMIELSKKRVPLGAIEDTTKKVLKKIKNNYNGGNDK